MNHVSLATAAANGAIRSPTSATIAIWTSSRSPGLSLRPRLKPDHSLCRATRLGENRAIHLLQHYIPSRDMGFRPGGLALRLPASSQPSVLAGKMPNCTPPSRDFAGVGGHSAGRDEARSPASDPSSKLWAASAESLEER